MSSVSSQGVKRRRVDVQTPHFDAFASANEIDQALRFQSSISLEVKASINRFKDFLTSISKHDEGQNQQQKKLLILKDYCTLQTAHAQEQVDFPDLISTWTKAVETGNDSIASAVPAALAQFFKTISGVLEFREFGLSLSHTLLKRNQVRLLDRGLSSQRTKEHLISPCLRLLTEITSFDGGTMANQVFNHRDSLFRRLDGLLEVRSNDATEDRRRPTVRRMSLRLLIANLMCLDARAKAEFFAQHRIFRAMAKDLSTDGDDIVLDIIKTIGSGVVDDVSVSRSSKLKFFTPEMLSGLSALYHYEAEINHPDSAEEIRQSVHRLLLKTCTTSKGIVLSQNGWYPLGYDPGWSSGSADDHINLGLDSPLYFDDYSQKLPVRNTTLSAFCQTLKPDKDVLEADLLSKILIQVPELVADYFTRVAQLSVSLGDDSRWRGRFALYFSIVQAPVPKNLISSDEMPQFPPPISVVIESILPKPFDKTTLSRFFTLNDEMLVLSGSRLLTVALSKLSKVLSIFQSNRNKSILWTQAYQRLVEAVLHKVPRYKDLIEAYQRGGKGNSMLTAALFECMAMYHQLLPEATTGSNFDVGQILLEALRNVSSDTISAEESINVLQQISWLIVIARLSPATKWWSKSDANNLTLFTMVTRFVLSDEDRLSPEALATLSAVIVSSGVVSNLPASFAAFLQSLKVAKRFTPSEELYTFVDNSLHRAVQKPVRYLDRIEKEQKLASDKTDLSIFACAVAEQWSFALQKHSGQKSTIKDIAKWIARYYNALDNAGENFRVLTQLKDDMLEAGDEKSRDYLKSAFQKLQKHPIEPFDQVTSQTQQDKDTNTTTSISKPQRSVNLNEVLGPSVPPPNSLDTVDRWDSKTDIEHTIQTGRMATLIRCLSSAVSEIRLQAFHLLQNVTHLVDESAHAEKVQIHMLLGELCETTRQQGLTDPVPSIATELAVKLLHIVADPAHKLFSQANKFLLRSPSWDLKRLIPQWTATILFSEPDSDEPGSWTESVEWYVSWLADGLKTRTDMEMYRRSGVFEKLLALYSSPATLRSTQKLVLAVLWRAVCAGGADTLITRVGLHKWLEIMATMDIEHTEIITELGRSLSESSDSQTIAAWKRSCPLTKNE